MSSRLIKFLDVVDCIFIKLNTSSNILHEISKAAIYKTSGKSWLILSVILRSGFYVNEGLRNVKIKVYKTHC